MDKYLLEEIKHIDINVARVHKDWYQADIIYRCRDICYEDYVIYITFCVKFITKDNKSILEIALVSTRIENIVKNEDRTLEYASNVNEQIELNPISFTVYTKEEIVKHEICKSNILYEKFKNGYIGVRQLYIDLR
jgi:hypothetical protein